jgi:Tfp pilus assembly protein PilV
VSVTKKFNMPTMRRLEIERYARTIDVADTDDFPHILIAWQWHNINNSKDPAGALIEAAKRMHGTITEQQAEQIIEEANARPKIRKADALGRYLRLTDKMRTALGITTIGSFDLSKRQRALRKSERSRARKEMKRRAAGKKTRAEYLAAAKSRTQPWKVEGKSRSLWYSRRKAAGQVRPHPPSSPRWTGAAPPDSSKAGPHLSKLIDRKEMAEGE